MMIEENQRSYLRRLLKTILLMDLAVFPGVGGLGRLADLTEQGTYRAGLFLGGLMMLAIGAYNLTGTG